VSNTKHIHNNKNKEQGTTINAQMTKHKAIASNTNTQKHKQPTHIIKQQ